MQHEGKGALRRLLLQDAGDVLVGVAGMDDERQAQLARRRDMGAEASLLQIARAVVVVIVEPGLADRHHLGMPRQAHDLVQRDVFLFVRMMRMGADRAEDSVMGLDNLEQLAEAPHPRGDRHHEADPRRTRTGKHRLTLGAEIGKIEMAVTVDEHIIQPRCELVQSVRWQSRVAITEYVRHMCGRSASPRHPVGTA